MIESGIDERWLGRRVSVRRVAGVREDGSAATADVVGDLVSLDAARAVVDTRHGPVEVGLDSVVAARQAPPSSADELEVERVAALGLRAADTTWLGGWLLRADHGFLRRANSVLPLRSPGMPVPDALDAVRAWYDERGLPPTVAAMAEARRLLDNDLDVRGWRPVVEAHIMTARLDMIADMSTLDATRPEVELANAPSPEWLHVRADGDEPADEHGVALLTRHDTVVFATIRRGVEVAAVARGVVDEGWLGVSSVAVAPRHRRQGLAGAIVGALVGWAGEHGATRSYLQVEADNSAAITLYEKLGYAVHHDYRYRVAPPPGFVPARPW